jgi:hypothetical protein
MIVQEDMHYFLPDHPNYYHHIENYKFLTSKYNHDALQVNLDCQVEQQYKELYTMKLSISYLQQVLIDPNFMTIFYLQSKKYLYNYHCKFLYQNLKYCLYQFLASLMLKFKLLHFEWSK